MTKRYLFVCAYAQSRSKFMAERFMDIGKRAMFVGYEDDADFKITKEHIDWADEIILLCEHIERTVHYDYIQAKVADSNNEEEYKTYIKHYIDDEPQRFEQEYVSLMTTLETKKNGKEILDIQQELISLLDRQREIDPYLGGKTFEPSLCIMIDNELKWSAEIYLYSIDLSPTGGRRHLYEAETFKELQEKIYGDINRIKKQQNRK